MKAGLITYGPKKVKCTIGSVSAVGATLKVSSTIGIPDQFVLVVGTEHKSYACNVVFRNAASLSVVFA